MSETEKECFHISSSQNLSNEQKYAILMMVSAACKQLYGQESNKIHLLKKLILSFIEDLKIPTRVTKGILASFEDEEVEISMQPYCEVLLKYKDKNKDFTLEIIEFLLTSTLNSEALYGYDAHARVVILHSAVHLGIKSSDFVNIENCLIRFLKSHSRSSEEDKVSENRSKEKTVKRGVLIGLTAIGGGAIIGLTGGLASPMIAAGASAIFGSSAAIIGTGVGSAILGSVFGVAGAGLTGYKMKKRIGEVKIFEFLPLSETKQLHAVIAVSGYLKKDVNDFFLPWRQLDMSQEQYTLKWEPEELLQMGSAIDYFISAAKTAVVTETLKYTALSGLMTAIAWPASLLSIASVLDNPWSVCINRAQDAGLILADVILNRQHGCRPITLIGFSLGARLIYACLKELSKRKNAEGVIQDVYIFGGPVTANSKDWETVLPVLSGRLLNGYCKNDWILKFLFRFSEGTTSLAGLMPILSKYHRIQNFDLTEFINGHGDYYQNMTAVLDAVAIPIRAIPMASSSDENKLTLKVSDPVKQDAVKQNKSPSDTHTPERKKRASSISYSPKLVLSDTDTEVETTKKRHSHGVGSSYYNDALSSIQITTDIENDSSQSCSQIQDVQLKDFIIPKSSDSSDITTKSGSFTEVQEDEYRRDSLLYNKIKPICPKRESLIRKTSSYDSKSKSEPNSPIHKIANTFRNLFNFYPQNIPKKNLRNTENSRTSERQEVSSTPDLFRFFDSTSESDETDETTSSSIKLKYKDSNSEYN